MPTIRKARLAVFDSGIRYTAESLPTKPPPAGTVRGEIKGFSTEAAARMREWCLTMKGKYGSASCVCAVTLTIREPMTPEQWRSAVKRFRTELKRKCPDWAGIWRVELQRRKVPHLHCTFWAPPSMQVLGHWVEMSQAWVYVTIRDLWLQATRAQDKASEMHAVHCRELIEASGWTIYATLHNSKQAGAQLGWVGKQWGIWNRDAWVPADPLTEGEISYDDAVTLLRAFRRWRKAKTGKAPRWTNPRRSCDLHISANVRNQLLRIFEQPTKDENNKTPV